MTISQIYEKYQIPPNLQRHQLEVAAVGAYVCDHWKGPAVNKSLILRALLLHDMGNIIKFKRPFLGEIEPQAAYWERVQQEYIDKYGADVTEATNQIVKELGQTEVVRVLVDMKAVWANPEKETWWEARICEYADCCVTPDGIVGFQTRLEDLKKRYHQSEEDSAIQMMRKNGELVESQVSVDLKDLAAIDFSPQIQKLPYTEII